jgi:hypothetical protein
MEIIWDVIYLVGTIVFFGLTAALSRGLAKL